MLAGIRKCAQREMQGKLSTFNVRDKPVDEKKIERFLKRKEITEETLLSQPSPVAGEHTAVSV